jgi:ribosomal protein L24
MRPTKHSTSTPTQHSRIVNGCTVVVHSRKLKGKRGKALLLSGSLWLIEVEGASVTLHRTCLKRIREGQVTA